MGIEGHGGGVTCSTDIVETLTFLLLNNHEPCMSHLESSHQSLYLQNSSVKNYIIVHILYLD